MFGDKTMSEWKLSRRSLFLGVGGTMLATTFGQQPEAANARSKKQIAPPGNIDASCFSKEWQKRFTVPFPACSTLPDAGRRPMSSTVTVTWDPRLFDVGTSFGLITGRTATTTTATQHAPGRLTVPVGRAATALLLHASTKRLYPYDSITTPVASRLTFSWTGNEPALSITHQAASPWGAELYASWATVGGLSYPTDVLVRSVGPNPVPAGAQIVLRSASSTPAPRSTAAPRRDGGAGRHAFSGRLRDAIFTLSDGVPAAGELRIDASSGSRLLASNAPQDVAEVFLRSSKRNAASARATRRISAVPLTDSGALVSAGSKIEGA